MTCDDHFSGRRVVNSDVSRKDSFQAGVCCGDGNGRGQ